MEVKSHGVHLLLWRSTGLKVDAPCLTRLDRPHAMCPGVGKTQGRSAPPASAPRPGRQMTAYP